MIGSILYLGQIQTLIPFTKSYLFNVCLVQADWSRLLGVGLAFIFIGLIMVMVNRILTAREEEELSQYVKQRLSRTRCGL